MVYFIVFSFSNQFHHMKFTKDCLGYFINALTIVRRLLSARLVRTQTWNVKKYKISYDLWNLICDTHISYLLQYNNNTFFYSIITIVFLIIFENWHICNCIVAFQLKPSLLTLRLRKAFLHYLVQKTFLKRKCLVLCVFKLQWNKMIVNRWRTWYFIKQK